MFRRTRVVATIAGVAAAVALSVPAASASGSPRAAASPTSAAAAAATVGTTSALDYLKAHNKGFDKNWYNYSIATSILVYNAANFPDQALDARVNDGRVPLTLFVPNDRAFQILLKQVTGKTYTTEASVRWHIGLLHMNDVQNLMLGHIVMGSPLTARAVLASNGKNLRTAFPNRSIHVAVYHFRRGTVVSLWDTDRRLRNPRVILSQVDLNAGNRQVIHGIDRVLLGFREHMSSSWFIGGSASFGPSSCVNGICLPETTPGHG